MTAIMIIALVFVALALAMRDSKILELRKQAKEGLVALRAGIADVERHIERICNQAPNNDTKPNQAGTSDQDRGAEHDCGCTPEKREEVCKAAFELLNQAKVAQEHAGDHKISELNARELASLVEQISAAALKVSQARRVLLNKPAGDKCHENDQR